MILMCVPLPWCLGPYCQGAPSPSAETQLLSIYTNLQGWKSEASAPRGQENHCVNAMFMTQPSRKCLVKIMHFVIRC